MEAGLKLPLRKSIATKMLLVVVGFYLLIATMVTLSQVWMEYRYQKKNIIQDLSDIESAFKNGLAVNIWGFDQEALNASLEGMLKIPSLVGVKINNAAGATIAIGGIVPKQGKTGDIDLHVNLTGLSDNKTIFQDTGLYKYEVFDHQFLISYDLENKSNQLGQATIYSNSSVIYRRMKLQIILLAVNVLLTLSTFFLALLWAFNRYLRRPLASLASASGEVRLENLDTYKVNIGISDQNELKVLEESFNTMIDNLHRSMAERVTAEDNLRIVNRELNSKNKELEQILYVASHDLRSPLVNVQGFSKELINDFQDIVSCLDDKNIPDILKAKLEPALKEDIPLALGFIGRSVTKMDALLTGLLKITRLGRAAININLLDMNKLVSETAANFEFQMSEIGLKIQVEDLPKCRGDELQTGQVFSNLIGNAIKFSKPDKEGIIKISGREQGEFVVYCVEDNGIGINKAHQKKIFEIFHKLDSDEEGQGLGLNIVKTIIERQGGEVWVDSEPGKFSSFFVSLPKC